jgi:N-acetylneuraminate synthase
MTEIQFHGRTIGDGHPCFVIAEAGVNHNGNPDLAERLIDISAESGADVVKFQTFDPDALAGASAAMAEYQAVAMNDATSSQRDMLRGLTLPKESYPRLIAHAKKRNILFLSTPFDERSSDFLEQLGLPAFKISSGDLNNTLLLAHIAKKRLPMLVSTGMGTIGDIARALETLAQNGAPPVALFHCVSNYPASPEDCNLRAMATIRSAFQVAVGWSDHTTGIDISLAAIALGAQLLEKHVTLDRTMPGPDHKASLEPAELTALVAGIRRIERALGSPAKAPRPAEIPIANIARRSLHWARSLPAGAVVTLQDLIALRPGTGVEPAASAWLIGRATTRAVSAGAMLARSDFEQT